MQSVFVLLVFLCIELYGRQSIASQELVVGNAPLRDDERVAEVDKLAKALASSECPARWEGIKEAISSWEQAFYLYPEIERRTSLDPPKNPSHKKLMLIKEFIRDEIVAMRYKENLDTKLQEAKSGGRNRELQVQKELEMVIRDSSEIFLKRIYSVDASLDLSVGPTLQEYISDRDRNVGVVASNVVVMRGGYAELDKSLLEMIKRSLLDGLRTESFAIRYFSLRSLEKLRSNDDSAVCIDPTDTLNSLSGPPVR